MARSRKRGRLVAGLLGAGLLLSGLAPAAARAGCGQLATCNAGDLCMYSGDNLTGTPIQNVAGSNPTLNFTNCTPWNDVTASAFNNATTTSNHFRLYHDTNYAGATLCLNKGDTVSGSTGMGTLYHHVEAEKLVASCP